MKNMLWGGMPHSLSATFDSASPLERAKLSKQAINLIKEKTTILSALKKAQWTKKALALLGVTASKGEHESIKMLRNIANGGSNASDLDVIYSQIKSHVDTLDQEELLSGMGAEVAHMAINTWAGMEKTLNV